MRPCLKDHPRSRGVYCGVQYGPGGCAGSSPLARGLHHVPVPHVPRNRIIPARAGFTLKQPCIHGQHGDHPRSRGVYHLHRSERTASWGSSPLARGLPQTVPELTDRSGIIPACAGFTADVAHEYPHHKDHPRSRGVYADRHTEITPGPGSSPLARGLHVRYNLSSKTRRIIPARAGFTTRQ